MKKRKIRVADAVGKSIAHDLTRIILGKFKDAGFKMGHIITEKDIPVLMDMGKNHIFIIELGKDELHEQDAATVISNYITGDNLAKSEIREGKINLSAMCDGTFICNKKMINKINSSGKIMISTLHENSMVTAGNTVASAKIIPISIKKEYLMRYLNKFTAPVLSIEPFKIQKAGIISTGDEVFSGRIKDKFIKIIKKSFLQMVEDGAELILIAYLDEVPIVGIPAAAIFHKATALDVFLPRIISKIKIKKADILSSGVGGLCLKCKTCHFPVCPFGK